MKSDRGKGEFRFASVCAWPLCLFASINLLAGPVGLPDTARPGAQRPAQEVFPAIKDLEDDNLLAGPVGLPDSARPGAQRPSREDKLDLPEPPPDEVLKSEEEQADESSAADTAPVAEPDEEEAVVTATEEEAPAEQTVKTDEEFEAEAAEEKAITEADDATRPPPEDTVDVPPVIDRPFDVTECPCIVVEKFRLLNAEDMPDHDVALDEVQQILGELIQQQPASGFSIGQLQEVAQQVRNYYRERGLILTQVVVPVQTIEEGVVDLELYVGVLDRILTESNEMYSQATLEMAFGDLVGKPVNKSEIEAALLRLTDYPGLTVFGVFQPGQKVGTADIVLKVQEEKRFDVDLRVDNHGTPETGRNRFRTVIDWNNVTGPDRLTAIIQQTYTPKNNVFKSIAYERYLGSSYKFDASFDVNKFDVGGEFADQNIKGESEVYLLGIEKSFIRSRLENLNAGIDFYRKESTTDTDGSPTNRDRLTTLVFGVDYDSVDTFSPFTDSGGGINFASLELTRGFNNIFGAMGDNASAQLKDGSGFEPSRQGGSGKFAEGQFTRIFASFTRLQTLVPGQNLLIRGEWQWSDDLLVPLEQYAVGGPENVRAIAPSAVLWDRALFFSLEWLISAPFIADQPAFDNRKWGEILQFTVFYDYARGRLNDALDTEQQGYDEIDGAGVGLRFNLPGQIDSRLFWAWEIGGDNTGNDRRPQIWGDFTYSF